jgi:hypothetical protein
MRRIKPEAAVQKCVTDYLTAKRVLWFRMNSGAVVSEYKGKSRMIRYGTPGCADLVAFPKASITHLCGQCENVLTTSPAIMVFWLEIKAPNGVQSDAQKSFQQLVESNGHRYALIRSIEDLEGIL